VSETGDRIIDATMRLLADRPFEEVTLGAIADEAGLSLALLAAHFPTRGHILDGFARRIDQEVLARDFTDMADEAPRDRLFDVLMSRLDSLAPYRGALKSLMRSVRRDPALGVGLNAIAVRSASWMLAAAGIAPTGWRGRLVTQGLAVSFTRVLRVFVDEEDPGLPRTMAALDKELREAEQRHRRFARMFGEAVRVAPVGGPAASDAQDTPASPPTPAPTFPEAPAPEPGRVSPRTAAPELDEMPPDRPATAVQAPVLGPGPSDAEAPVVPSDDGGGTDGDARGTSDGESPPDEKTAT
jgi:AcrR family transcriptional regulator